MWVSTRAWLELNNKLEKVRDELEGLKRRERFHTDGVDVFLGWGGDSRLDPTVRDVLAALVDYLDVRVKYVGATAPRVQFEGMPPPPSGKKRR